MSAALIEVLHLPGLVRLRTTLAVPPDRLRPVIATRSGRAWLDHDLPYAVPGVGHGLCLDIPCDLSPHRLTPGRRLQLWACGFLLHEEALTPDPAFTGAIDGIDDYDVTAWIALAGEQALPEVRLSVDGHDIARMLEINSGNLLTQGLTASLPESCLDGRRHRIEITIEGQVVASRHWRSQAKFTAALNHRHLSLRFADPALRRGAVTISAQADGHTLWRQTIDPSGADLEWSLPDSASTITLSAGAHAQRVIAALHPMNDAVTRARRRARALLLADAAGSAAARTIDRAALNIAPSGHAGHRSDVSGNVRGVTVIVPVYRGALETQSCLASLAASAEAGDAINAIIVVNDASPDPAIATILQAFAAPGAPIPRIVLHQDHNQGFAAAINRALADAMPDHDVILLNADTIVPEFFATRLRAAAHSRPDIASATPLSNAGSVLGHPDPQADNALTGGETMAWDAALEAALSEPLIIPTGIGFCLYLKREALDDTGTFGLEWGHGYCEEVDWCLRARDRGWSHVAARDVAVFHHASVSFGARQREVLLARNHKLLERRYPEYTGEIRQFLQRDALAPLRAEAFCRLIAEADSDCLLHFTHDMGGGTAILVASLAQRFTGQGGTNLICSRVHDDFRGEDVYVIRWTNRGLALRLPHAEITQFVETLRAHQPSLGILIHSLTGVGPAIRVIAELPVPYSIYAHDYQWICPRVVLVDQTGLHCGEPGLRYCQLCVRANPIHDFAGEEAAIRADLPAWIGENTRLLERAQSVLIPSQDAFVRLRRHFPHAALRVLPHPERQISTRITRAPDTAEVTRIAVCGGLSVQKGRDVVLRLCRAIQRESAPLAIGIFGAIEESHLFDGIACATLHGPYGRETLACDLDAFDPHFVFFPAVWPETWCFALSDIWAAGYPAVAFDIGAIAERIRATGAGVLLPFEPLADLIAPLCKARDEAGRLHGLDFAIAPDAADDPARELFGQSR